jgi:two-component system, OmpR family, heavy metal sensor histidine kinase CusS
MFWKNVNKNKAPSLSLVNQMIVFYSLTTIGIVVFVCMILFPTFEKITHVYNTAYQDNLLSQCIIKLIIALLFSTISAIIFSSIITKKGMHKIYDLSEQIKNTTIDSLATKIKIIDLPKELQPLGESYNIMLDKLQNSFNQISQFSSDIAHELRNPLHNLLGMNEVALTNQYSLEKHREICESNLDECRYLLKLIDNLWFIASSDHHHLSINKILLNTQKEILNIVDYYEFYSVEQEIKVSCEGEALLYADLILFKRAISNILSNALRYTQKNGKIDIKIETLAEYITISINDTGIGIEEKHLSKLFDRFYRVDASRSSKTGGLGLGLAIVKSIMDLHHGNCAATIRIPYQRRSLT